MSRPVDYCTVEFDFLTGGSNCTFMSLTAAQRFAYICAWNYAVHLRKSYLTNYEIVNRLGAIYDIDRRTVAKMLQTCCKDARLLTKTDDGYNITGVMLKHGKLKKFAAVKVPVENEKPVDSIVQDSIVQDSKGEKPEPNLFPPPEKTKRFKPPTVGEVKEYCDSRNNGVDPEKFVNHYDTNGWMRGKTKIKNWKACVRTWEGNDKKPQRQRESFERKHKKYPKGERIDNGVPNLQEEA